MYDFSEIGELLEKFMEDGLGITMVANFGSSALRIAAYVLTSLALYSMAKRRGINNPWLSWIPLANCWIIGCLSDQYRYVVKGEVKNKRKTLLALNIINLVLTIAMAVIAIIMAVSAIQAGINANEQEAISAVLGSLIGILALCLPIIGISIAVKVVHYIALYDIYSSSDPQNNVLFLVLGIFFPILESIFLFVSRKKDEGMPPRRQESQYVPQQPQYEQPSESL